MASLSIPLAAFSVATDSAMAFNVRSYLALSLIT